MCVFHNTPIRELRLRIEEEIIDESQPQTSLKLWQAFGAVYPDSNGKYIIDLMAQVHHAIEPDSPLRPVGIPVEERFTKRLRDQQSIGGEFAGEQVKWPVAIRDPISSILTTE